MKNVLLTVIVVIIANVLLSVHANEQPDNLFKDAQVVNLTENIPAVSVNDFHFITHGRPGELLIEGKWRNAPAIVQFIQQRQLLTEGVRRLNIYGCEFAKGATGLAAVQYLQKQLQVVVAASTNVTGIGGDYILEIGNIDARLLFAGFNGSLQCAGTPGGTGDNDDFDRDGICNSDDIDDDNDGILDDNEMSCGEASLNANGYTNGGSVSTSTTTTNGIPVETSFSTIRSNSGLSDSYPDGTADGVLTYSFSSSQSDTGRYNYITELNFNRPVKVTLVYPGDNAPGVHSENDIFSMLTPGTNTSFTVVNPENELNIIKDVQGEIVFNPTGTSNPTGRKQNYSVATNQLVTRVQLRVANTYSSGVNTASIRVIIEACEDEDADKDNIPSRLDVDSDGDQCPDTYESGVPGATKGSGSYTDSVVIDPAFPTTGVGANGYKNSFETSTDNGVPNFTNTYRTYAVSASQNACADADNDGVEDVDDIDDDNDGILDETEVNCGEANLNANGYTNGAATSTTTTTSHGIPVQTSFSTTRSNSGLSTNYPDGTAEGVLTYYFSSSQNDTGVYNYTTELNFDKPVKVRLVFPGEDAPGYHGYTDVFSLITPGSSTAFELYNPDNAIVVLQNRPGIFQYAPNTHGNDTEMEASKQGYYVETSEAVTRVQIKTGSTYGLGNNYGSVKVIIEVCDNPDRDNDGIPNQLDLDSDGDGCSDASETGISNAQPGTIVNNNGAAYSPAAIARGGYGNNGFSDDLETAAESGMYNGSYASYADATNSAAGSCPPMPLLRPDINVTPPGKTATGNLSTNDSIPAGSTYGSAVAVPGYTNPGTATPTINNDGTYTFSSTVPGVYQFYVPVCPPSVTTNCPQALLTIHVIDRGSFNNLPVTAPDFASIQTNTSATFATLANDEAGVYGYGLETASVRISTAPKNGTAVVDAATGNIIYTPQEGFAGIDTLYYRVCDDFRPTANCNTGMQIVTVLPPAAANTVDASDDYASLQNTDVKQGNVTANDYNAGTTALTATPQTTTVAGAGTFTLMSNGSYSFDPVDNFTGPVNFPYQVCNSNSPAACKGGTAYFLVNASPNTVLPVKLVEFSGKNTQEGNQVTWITAVEINSSHFELRHSTNGTSFNGIATVAAAGSSNGNITYGYLHTNPIAGNNFYQLISVDKDGRRESSKIINVTTRQRSEVVLYPNPSNGLFVLRGDKEEISSISIFNVTAAEVTQQVQITRINERNVQINMAALPNGVYFLKTKTKGFKIIKR